MNLCFEEVANLSVIAVHTDDHRATILTGVGAVWMHLAVAMIGKQALSQTNRILRIAHGGATIAGHSIRE